MERGGGTAVASHERKADDDDGAGHEDDDVVASVENGTWVSFFGIVGHIFHIFGGICL